MQLALSSPRQEIFNIPAVSVVTRLNSSMSLFRFLPQFQSRAQRMNPHQRKGKKKKEKNKKKKERNCNAALAEGSAPVRAFVVSLCVARRSNLTGGNTGYSRTRGR